MVTERSRGASKNQESRQGTGVLLDICSQLVKEPLPRKSCRYQLAVLPFFHLHPSSTSTLLAPPLLPSSNYLPSHTGARIFLLSLRVITHRIRSRYESVPDSALVIVGKFSAQRFDQSHQTNLCTRAVVWASLDLDTNPTISSRYNGNTPTQTPPFLPDKQRRYDIALAR